MSETTEKLPQQAKASLDFAKLEIASDGTSAGTTVLLNGKPIADLAYLNFSFWRCDKNSYCGPISIGFTTTLRFPPGRPRVRFWISRWIFILMLSLESTRPEP